MLTPDGHISFSKAGMLSEDGRCKTFSKHANGYVRGEGVGMLVLKKLTAAERDGDHIYGVIRGSAENHGGRAQSLTAPNPKAQAELLKAAYSQRRDRSADGRLHRGARHRDGARRSDRDQRAEERVRGFARSERRCRGGFAYCGLGSVKSNIGHLELAAGVAGVIKVLLQLQHKTLVEEPALRGAESVHRAGGQPVLHRAGDAGLAARCRTLQGRDCRAAPA